MTRPVTLLSDYGYADAFAGVCHDVPDAGSEELLLYINGASRLSLATNGRSAAEALGLLADDPVSITRAP